MLHIMFWIAMLFVALLGGCAGDGPPEAPSPPDGGGTGSGGSTIDYETQVQPIFTQNCSCHQSFSAPQGEILLPGASYDSLVGVKSTENPAILRVHPGDPQNSYLMIKIDDSTADVSSRRVGDRMPRGLPPLDPGDIATIRQWIVEGAHRTTAPSDPNDKQPPRFNGATLAVVASSSAIDVFWDTASDDKTTADKILYRVYVALNSRQQDFSLPRAISAPGATSFRIESLEPGTRYFLVVRARDA